MATQTTGLNRSAADRNSAMNSGAAFRSLTKGARTMERNIIPPTQLTAARICRTTNVEYMPPHDNRSRQKNRHGLSGRLLNLRRKKGNVLRDLLTDFNDSWPNFLTTIDSCPMFSVEEAMRLDLHRFKLLALVACTAFLSYSLNPMIGNAQQESPYERIAGLALGSPMMAVAEGSFLMGTLRTGRDLYSLDFPYDDTEQPQRRVWLDRFEIDRDEVSLGEFLLWLNQEQRSIPAEIRKLIDHMTTVHAVPADTLARWPALYISWADASDFCRAQGKRLPSEAEWEKAARGEKGNLFPWGRKPPVVGLAMFGQYHVHEIPIVAAVESGEEGRSPYGLHHMAGNAAEWVEDWFGIDYYATMPDRNPRGVGQSRYRVVRGGSWKSAPPLLRTATRSGASPELRTATIGFRCAKSVR